MLDARQSTKLERPRNECMQATLSSRKDVSVRGSLAKRVDHSLGGYLMTAPSVAILPRREFRQPDERQLGLNSKKLQCSQARGCHGATLVTKLVSLKLAVRCCISLHNCCSMHSSSPVNCPSVTQCGVLLPGMLQYRLSVSITVQVLSNTLVAIAVIGHHVLTPMFAQGPGTHQTCLLKLYQVQLSCTNIHRYMC